MAKKSSRKPAATPDENRVRMTFYIDRPVLAELQARNQATGVPVAHMIRLAIDQFIGREFNKAAGATVRTVGKVEELRSRPRKKAGRSADKS